jgi:hypothetical protein
MRKFVIGIMCMNALLFAGVVASNSHAAPLAGVQVHPTEYSLIDKIACGPWRAFAGKHACVPGFHPKRGICVPCQVRMLVCPLPAACCTGSYYGSYYDCRAVHPGCYRYGCHIP